LDSSVPTDIKVPNKTYTALVWHSSYYNHTSGLKCTTIVIQELSKVCQAKVYFPKYEEWTSACISGRLYLEMCTTNKLAVIYQGQDNEQKINWYYEQATTYARRASAGNFDGKNAKYKPVFHLDSKDFSPELRANLEERLNTSKESLHRVVEDAVFMIFRARHSRIFYEHIEADGLRWEFV
jgi:hypothetical protein